ncbi:unnamed protein product [Orchesella dallaii]|uniref:HTH CENPB-type domain-containing protein n=1 Tax=Orchesella dallaii TaxID=48710 RepID=A0ABP1R8Y5_9HEXA
MNYIKRWRNEVKSGGTAFEKWNRIETSTYEKFCEARKDHKCIKETNIRDWAMQAFQSFRDESFQFVASHTWIHEFKKKYRISSRKVTKLVTRREIKSMEEILTDAKKFQTVI